MLHHPKRAIRAQHIRETRRLEIKEMTKPHTQFLLCPALALLKETMNLTDVILGKSPTQIRQEANRHLCRTAAATQRSRTWLRRERPTTQRRKAAATEISELEKIADRVRNEEPQYHRRGAEWVRFRPIYLIGGLKKLDMCSVCI